MPKLPPRAHPKPPVAPAPRRHEWELDEFHQKHHCASALLPLVALIVVAFLQPPSVALAEYSRPVDIAPTPESIGGGYITPDVQRPLPRESWLSLVDTGLLIAGMSLTAYLVLKRRSRNWLVALSIGSLLYFGFHRKGCICPIGAIQNITVAFTDPGYVVPMVALLFFFLPLLFTLLFGRAFCGGVCPLGAIQELVLLKPVQVPRRLDKVLGLFKYLYLAVAVAYAARPQESREFLICRFDPFVGFFRMNGPGTILMFGGTLLLIGTMIGRPYCRYLCPYGAILSILSRFSWKNVTITPDKELDCGLCSRACPYGAIENMRAVRSSCLACARCYVSCPRERVQWHPDSAAPAIHPSDSQAGRTQAPRDHQTVLPGTGTG